MKRAGVHVKGMSSPQHHVSVTTNRLAIVKGPPEKLPHNMTETTTSQPKWIHIGLRRMEVENVILALEVTLFNFDENEPVM